MPEFTLLEWYRTDSDYMSLMGECEDMIIFIADELKAGSSINYINKEIDLKTPWDRLTVYEAFRMYSPISPEEAIASGRFDEIMIEDIEPQLNFHKPVFLYDYPLSLGALSREKDDFSGLAERFETLYGGT